MKGSFLVKYSISPYMIPDMIMTRHEGKTWVFVLTPTGSVQAFDEVQEAERFWKMSRPIGSADLWCD